jgi:1,2-diacylglycerol 3-alpha-glucosyltransferase
MKILHCCLACFYIDGYGYQENVLPKMHKLQGHEVKIVASTETFINDMYLGYSESGTYLNENGIAVTRLPYVLWLPFSLARKIRKYSGLIEQLEQFQPEIIFIHDLQFFSIYEIIKYLKMNRNVKVYIDGHTDYGNSGKNWLAKNILHRIIYKRYANAIEPYVRKYYGTLPLRVDFIKKEYGIKPEKVELLELGGDSTAIDLTKRDEIRGIIRKEHNIKEDDFLIVTGGKLDLLKGIHLLMRAVREIDNIKIKLLVFGKPNQESKGEIEYLSNSKNIRYVGWVNSNKIYEYFISADMAFFPGTHSVLWEQAISVGLPGVFKKHKGIEHIDVGGNAMFIEKIDVKNIRDVIENIYNNKEKYIWMKKTAMELGVAKFDYFEIAKRAIEQE